MSSMKEICKVLAVVIHHIGITKDSYSLFTDMKYLSAPLNPALAYIDFAKEKSI